MQCKAHNRKGEKCKNSAMPGKEVCRFHGGMSLSGPASPTWKHGRYSKYMPEALMKKYEEAQRDPDLLNLRGEISLLDVHIFQLVEKLPEGGASHSWVDLNKAWNEFLQAQRLSNAARTDEERRSAQVKAGDALRRLNEIVTEGAQEAGVWNDIITSVDNRRKLTASEAKRLVDMQQTITAEKAIALVYAMLDIIRRNLSAYKTDKKTVDDFLQAKIAEDIRALVTIPVRNDATDN